MPRAPRDRRHERTSPLVDPEAIIDEVAIGYVMAGKRPFSILHWEEQMVVWDRWQAKQTAKKPKLPFYKAFEVDVNYSRMMAGAAKTPEAQKLFELDRRNHPR